MITVLEVRGVRDGTHVHIQNWYHRIQVRVKASFKKFVKHYSFSRLWLLKSYVTAANIGIKKK